MLLVTRIGMTSGPGPQTIAAQGISPIPFIEGANSWDWVTGTREI